MKGPRLIASCSAALCPADCGADAAAKTPVRRCLRSDNRCPVNGIIFQRNQGVIGSVKREYRYLGSQVDLSRDLKKISSIGAGHIRDAAKLTLAPEQAIIIELGNAV